MSFLKVFLAVGGQKGAAGGEGGISADISRRVIKNKSSSPSMTRLQWSRSTFFFPAFSFFSLLLLYLFAHRLNLQIVAGENEDGTPVAIETASKLGSASGGCMRERLLRKNVPAFAPVGSARQRPRWRAATAAWHLIYSAALTGTLMIPRVVLLFYRGVRF